MNLDVKNLKSQITTTKTAQTVFRLGIFALLAAIIVRQAIAHVCENGDVQPGEIGRSDLSDPETAQDEPTGLKHLTRSDGANMGRRDASVEDRVKSGAVDATAGLNDLLKQLESLTGTQTATGTATTTQSAA